MANCHDRMKVRKDTKNMSKNIKLNKPETDNKHQVCFCIKISTEKKATLQFTVWVVAFMRKPVL